MQWIVLDDPPRARGAHRPLGHRQRGVIVREHGRRAQRNRQRIARDEARGVAELDLEAHHAARRHGVVYNHLERGATQRVTTGARAERGVGDRAQQHAHAGIERRQRAGQAGARGRTRADIARAYRDVRAIAGVQVALGDGPAVLLHERAGDRRHDVARAQRRLRQRHDA